MNHKDIALLSGALLSLSGTALAGGPLQIYDDIGTPYRWSQEQPVLYQPDRGSLGPLSNPEAKALVQTAFTHFSSIPTASLEIEAGDMLPEDITSSNFSDYVQKCDDRSPVIFDSDGSVTDAMLGQGASCLLLGFAGPECISSARPEILEGLAVINGLPLDPNGPCNISNDGLPITVAHELGHFLNLGHSQINGNHALYQTPVVGFEQFGVPPLDSVELMYPMLIIGERQSTVTQEETSWFSWLYPATPSPTTTTLYGDILDSEGLNPITGVNVIARDPSNPHALAISSVSGFLGSEDSYSSALKGRFELPLLEVGADYVISTEEVNRLFMGSASLPAMDPPLDLIPEEDAAFLEFYNPSWEAGQFPPDDPFDQESITLTSRSKETPIEIWLNYDLEPSNLSCNSDDICGPGWECTDNICSEIGAGDTFDVGGGNEVDGAQSTPTPTAQNSNSQGTDNSQGTPQPTGGGESNGDTTSSQGSSQGTGCTINARDNQQSSNFSAATLVLLTVGSRRRKRKIPASPKPPQVPKTKK